MKLPMIATSGATITKITVSIHCQSTGEAHCAVRSRRLYEWAETTEAVFEIVRFMPGDGGGDTPALMARWHCLRSMPLRLSFILC